jgi:hypothetical protein
MRDGIEHPSPFILPAKADQEHWRPLRGTLTDDVEESRVPWGRPGLEKGVVKGRVATASRPNRPGVTEPLS